MCRTAVSYARLLVRSGTDNTEAQTVVLVVSVAVVPARNPTAVAVAVIAAATVIAVDAAARVDIPAPLPNIAAHVVKPIAVRLFLRHRMRHISAVTTVPPTVPAYLIQIVAACIFIILSAIC